MNNEEQTTQNLLDRIVALQQRVRELEEREAHCREQTQALRQQLAQEQATRQNVETTLHQTEAALCQSEEHRRLANERFQWAATAVSALIYDWDIESDTVERTDGLTRILGYSLTEAEPTGKWWRARVHPEDFQRVSAEAATALAKGDFYTGEYRILHKNNHYIHVLDQGLVVARDAQGKPVRAIGSTTDISARKLAQEALYQSEQRLRLALDAARMVAWEWNLLEDALVYSATAAKVFGLPPGAKLESSEQAIALIHPDDTAYHRQIVNNAIASSGSYVAQFRLIRPIDGAVVWMEERGSVICDRTDKAVKLTGVLMDITELKQAEAALRDSEALAKARAKELEVFMEAVPLAVWIARDPQCHQVTANRTAYELVQLPSGSVATATPADGMYPFVFKIQRDGKDIPLHELPMQQAGRTGQDVEAEFDFVFENGEVRSLYGRAVPLRDNLGEVRGVIGAFLDVSERKRTEAALRESEERFRQMAETIQDVFWITDFRVPQILYVSPAYEKIWGR
ncbi:MAG TPA: PAS domain-containing protein, partial [Chroococcales cyanobacterium]